MKIVRVIPIVFVLACGEAKSPPSSASSSSTAPLTETRLELTLDDGTKPPPLDGRAFAVPADGGQLAIYVFDAKVSDATCTDVNVGGWFEKAQGNGVAQLKIASFSGQSGKYPVASITHVVGGRGKGKSSIRSARAKDVVLDLTRYDQVFEASVGPLGKVSGIVCAAK